MAARCCTSTRFATAGIHNPCIEQAPQAQGGGLLGAGEGTLIADPRDLVVRDCCEGRTNGASAGGFPGSLPRTSPLSENPLN
jgi:hypothetical protein